ncbi:Uncharacterised protein [uncultured archaeon]|nr:Uncharacterised protein [uncultured archaeon]
MLPIKKTRKPYTMASGRKALGLIHLAKNRRNISVEDFIHKYALGSAFDHFGVRSPAKRKKLAAELKSYLEFVHVGRTLRRSVAAGTVRHVESAGGSLGEAQFNRIRELLGGDTRRAFNFIHRYTNSVTFLHGEYQKGKNL